MTFPALMMKPSAFLPIAMSLAALTFTLVYIALFGIVHHADEGTPAHIFQLLMVTQVPIIAFFAIKWLSLAPWQALQVLAIQVGVAIAALTPVFYFKL